jgi:uncharacterized protein (DUF697 family)
MSRSEPDWYIARHDKPMNQSMFLHIVEKLEGLLGKLPATIQKPILHELTPLKELFLQQRSPRFVLTGSSRLPFREILPAFFGFASQENRDALMEIFRWHELPLHAHGTVAVLDARGADESAMANIHDELKRQPADIFFFIDDGDVARPPRKREIENLGTLLQWNEPLAASAKVIGVSLVDQTRNRSGDGVGKRPTAEKRAKLQAALEENAIIRDRLVESIQLPLIRDQIGESIENETQQLITLLAQHLPNQARVEMIRISRDRAAQVEVAQVLVKSTTAICTAIGAQPIPLADLPVLTTLQLAMVSGIMYLSGRERSLRAATEFLGALGANVGVGMLLREGTRALLKFFPGWGNVVCGMVAGAGTYAIGRAGIVYFIEGVSIKDARRTYQSSRKKPARLKIAHESKGRQTARKREG